MKTWKKRLNMFLAVLLAITSINFGAISAFAEVEKTLLDIPDLTFRKIVLRQVLNDPNRSRDGSVESPIYNTDIPRIEIQEELNLNHLKACSTPNQCIYQKKVADLKGIEYFTALKKLELESVAATSADFSSNTALEHINLKNATNMASVNLSENINLSYLDISRTKLKSLDLSNNQNLTNFIGSVEETIYTTKLDNKHRLYLNKILNDEEIDNYEFIHEQYNVGQSPIEPAEDLTGFGKYVELGPLDKLVFNRSTGNDDFPLPFRIAVGSVRQPAKEDITVFTIADNPDKLNYPVGDPFESEGLKIFVSDGNGKDAMVDLAGFINLEGSVEADGEPFEEGQAVDKNTKLILTHNDMQQEVDLTVDEELTPKDLDSIEFAADPYKKNYLEGETLQTSGLAAKLVYNDETEVIVKDTEFESNNIVLKIKRESGNADITEPLIPTDTTLIIETTNNAGETVSVGKEIINVKKVFNVKFSISEEGTVSSADEKYLNQNITEGEKIKNIPKVNPKAGYKFTGWITNGAILTDDDIKALDINKDLEIKAVFSKIDGRLLTEIVDAEVRKAIIKELGYMGRDPIPSVEIPDGYENPLYSTDLPKIETIKKLSVLGPYSQWSSDKPAKSVEGIELLKSLEELTLSRNDLGTMDLSKNRELKIVRAYGNKLDSVKLPDARYSKLEQLDLSDNNLKELDVRDHKWLNWIDAYNNQLEFVDTRGLIRANRMNMSNNKLSSLDMIDMRSLKTLTLTNNNFKTIDIRPAIGLEELTIANNGLEELMADGHWNINRIYAMNNNLKEVNLENTTNLWQLNLSDNPLEKLDTSQSVNMTNLTVRDTKLSELDLSKNTNLSSIDITNTSSTGGNTISELDFSNSPKLYRVDLNNNYLTKLDLSNNPQMSYIYAKNNMIKELLINENATMSGVDISNNQLMKVDYNLKSYMGTPVVTDPQVRTLAAEKVDGRFTVNLKELLGPSFEWVLNGYKGGELNRETGELKVFENRDSFEYTVGTGRIDGHPMNVKLLFIETDELETIMYVKPFETAYAVDGETVTLPAEAEVVTNKGEHKKMPVTWENDTVTVKKEDSPIVVDGVITGTKYPVKYEIKVVTIPVFEDIKVSQYQKIELPKEVDVEGAGIKEIVWEVDSVDTNEVGTQTIKGEISGIGEVSINVVVEEADSEAEGYLLNIPNEVLRKAILGRIYGRDPIPSGVTVPRDYNYPIYSTDLPKMKTITSLDIKGKDPNTVNNRPNPELTDLTGIEHLTGLKTLKLTDSDIKKIDLSHNKELTSFDSKYNNTEELILGELPKLTTLYLGGNKIKNLDLSGATELTRVEAPYNGMETIDVTGLKKLTRLWINKNNLQSVDTSTNMSLQEYDIAENNIQGVLDLTENKDIRYIRAQQNHITEIKANDLAEMRGLTVSNNDITKIDITNTPYLYSLNADNNLLEDITIETSGRMNELSLRNNKLTSIDITKIPELDRFYINNVDGIADRNNSIDTIDFSESEKLREIDLSGIGLETADFSKNLRLQTLRATHNNLTGLNLVGNTNISSVIVDYNKLTNIVLPKYKDYWSNNLRLVSCGYNELETLNLDDYPRLQALYCGGNHLVKLNLEKNEILGRDYGGPYLETQIRTVAAEEVDGVLKVDLKKLIGETDLSRVTNLKGGTLDMETGLVALEPGKKSLLYDYRTRNGYVPTMEVNLFIDSTSVEFIVDEEGAVVSEEDKPFMKQTVLIGDKVVKVPAVTANYGYEFLGWNEKGETELLSNDDIANMTIDKSKVFTANLRKMSDEELTTGIEIGIKPKDKYFEGDKIELSDMTVKVSKKDGTVEEVKYEDFSKHGISTNISDGTVLKLEDTVLEVSLYDHEATLPLEVAERPFDASKVTKMTVKKGPDKTEYNEKEKFDPKGMEIELTDSNDKTKTVAASDFAEYGIKVPTSELKVTDKEAEITKDGVAPVKVAITVKELPFDASKVTKMTVKKGPDKTEYNEKEKFDSKGMEIELTDSNDKTKTVGASDFAEYGIKVPTSELKVTDKEAEITKDGVAPVKVAITVKELPFDASKVTKMTVKKGPDKTEYKANEKFDPKGMEIELTDENGKTKTVGPEAFEEYGIEVPTTKLKVSDKEIEITKDGINPVKVTITVKKSTSGGGTVPTDPETPETPDKPDTPSTPDESDKPETPEEPEKPIKEKFKDIIGHWAEDYINKMVDLGFIDGYPDGTFKPQRNITRAEFAKTLVVAMDLEQAGTKVFNDSKSHWAKDYIATAYEHGMVKGISDTEFAPDRTITREEMTAMLMRVIEAKKVKDPLAFKDEADISDWAKEYVEKATEAGIIDGYNDGTFKPQGLATRAEAVKIIVSALFE